ncbi:hypothetical protein F8388_007755 [Cannabis sativa]|uniref:Fe2OG dioxygenase domain-containing protein n=1 Tax=Cannabis sativa TaxID=3483 RepID=A0A7J6G3P8_CANSA|nr:hypothetical protein F8388_007755 [Cannabis sativa]KAF4377615.1 hypothetical protein G4B88_006895 [Cannabis sativa]
MDFRSSNVVVPCVQELAKDPNMVSVPPRYIRNDQTQIDQTNNSSVISSDETPVINFQNLLLFSQSHHPELYQSELNKLHSACKEWGFFQLVNHGISDSLVEKIKEGIEKLCKLPIEEKNKLWRNPGDLEGIGDPVVFSDEQKLDWKDELFLITLPLALRNPHLFPNLPLPFRENLEIYSLQLAKLAKDIISQMEKVIGIESKEISKLFEDGIQSMSINYYPPCPQPEKVTGVAPHSDACGITFLLQLNQVDGFQVKKDGMWIPIKPLPNAFIIITNGIYLSNEHKAIVNSTKERMSIATFLNTNEDCEIGPAHSLITQQNPALYKTLSSKDYVKGIFSREVYGRSYVQEMKL